MKANNLTISVPNKGCDKNCPYCISKITGDIKSNAGVMLKNTHKVEQLAVSAQVSSVLITCKGETLLNYETALSYIDRFSQYPLELQTNGIWLSKNTEKIEELAQTGLNIVAVSVDSKPDLSLVSHMFRAIKSYGMLLRICFNFTDTVFDDNFAQFTENHFAHYPIDQVLIRNIGYPKHNVVKRDSITEWIDKHNAQGKYNEFYTEVSNEYTVPLIRTLAHGAKVFDYKGIAVCFSDYCIQEAHNEEDLRSLIFLEDGHLYTSWSSKASKIF
jgi:sulfatase maturation enzyme AslB (radical SAM superfamily)